MINVSGMNNTYCLVSLKCLLIFVFLSACGSNDSNDVNSEQNAMQEVNFSIIHEGINSPRGVADNEYLTLFNQQDYENKVGEFNIDSPLAIDFSNQRVLLVAMGERNTGGYTIDVVRIEEFSDGLVATVVLTSPGDNCIVTAALTSPYKFLQIPGVDDDIRVVEENVVANC